MRYVMRNSEKFESQKNKKLVIIASTATLLLLVPAIAMQFTDEVNWTLSDFLVAATLLSGTGLMIDFVIRKVKKTKYRIALAVILLAILLLVWAELAVGIFGTPISGQ